MSGPGSRFSKSRKRRPLAGKVVPSLRRRLRHQGSRRSPKLYQTLCEIIWIVHGSDSTCRRCTGRSGARRDGPWLDTTWRSGISWWQARSSRTNTTARRVQRTAVLGGRPARRPDQSRVRRTIQRSVSRCHVPHRLLGVQRLGILEDQARQPKHDLEVDPGRGTGRLEQEGRRLI